MVTVTHEAFSWVTKSASVLETQCWNCDQKGLLCFGFSFVTIEYVANGSDKIYDQVVLHQMVNGE